MILAWAASSSAAAPLSKGQVTSIIRIRSSSSTTMSGRSGSPDSRMVRSVVTWPKRMASVIRVAI